MLPVPWLMPSVSTCKALHPHLLIVIIRFIYFTSQLHDFYTSSFSVLSAVRSQGQGRVSLPLCHLVEFYRSLTYSFTRHPLKAYGV